MPDVADVPIAAIDAALKELADILGQDGLIVDEAKVAEFRDPFAPPTGRWYEPGAVLMPTSVEQVQEVLRVANSYKTPLWVNGQGRNNGYGGPAPRVSGSFVMSMRRMNRVLDVDEDSAWALVESGVTFFDLHDHLKSTGSKLWMSVPDLGWGSIVGNAGTWRGLYAARRSLRRQMRDGGGAREWRVAAHRARRARGAPRLARL